MNVCLHSPPRCLLSPQEASGDLSVYNHAASSDGDWSFNQFTAHFLELYSWLNSIQEAVYGKEETVTDRGLRTVRGRKRGFVLGTQCCHIRVSKWVIKLTPSSRESSYPFHIVVLESSRVYFRTQGTDSVTPKTRGPVHGNFVQIRKQTINSIVHSEISLRMCSSSAAPN